jgi:DHA1 family inner membrane transport protein
LSVASFNVGTAIGTAIAGAVLATPLGLTGPTIVGAVIVALTLIPTIGLAVLSRRGKTAAAPADH